ncbi:MAG: LPS-assembly protein LptD [Roseinatronobacter sp.]
MSRKRPATGLRTLAALLHSAWLACLLAVTPLSAQTSPEFSTLLADRLYLDGPSRLVADGNVEALSGAIRLRATRIIYDRATGALSITGPMLLTDGARVTMLADSAELTDSFRRGLIQSARVVLDDQLQIAAANVRRRDERFTEMSQVIASTCEICADRPTPLWEMRASRVVHDAQDRQLYFENAQFRLLGLPLLYLPSLRVPDPSLDRATGFLSPRFSVNTGHGVGLKTPYFIVLGPDRDVTLTPFVGAKGTRALDLRYRQAFASGMLELGGLVARDDIRPGGTRGMIYALGQFDLGQGYALSFNLIRASDRRLLDDYGRVEAGLASDITLSRIARDTRLRLQALNLRSLRVGDVSNTLPNHIGQAVYERRADVLGGVGAVRMELHSHMRRTPMAPDVRTMSRLSLDLDWRRDAILPGGIVGALGVNLGIDHARVSPAATAFARSATRVSPNLMLDLRWPLVRNAGSGAVHVLEPVAQVILGRNTLANFPNDLSLMPELDEGNLFSLNRFAARDQREGGLRANLGLSWTRYDPAGWSGTLTLGRIWRAQDLGQFSAASPVAGARSDWLLAARLDTDAGLTLSGRTLVQSGGRISRTALEIDWATEDFTISTSYMRILPDVAENRLQTSSEWSFEGSRKLDDSWTARLNWRYDAARKRAARVGAGIGFENECLRFEAGVERRFSTAANPNATTNLALNLDVLGVGGAKSGARRGCSNG